jgi:cytochrome c oxidase cbb3-type subunit 3
VTCDRLAAAQPAVVWRAVLARLLRLVPVLTACALRAGASHAVTPAEAGAAVDPTPSAPALPASAADGVDAGRTVYNARCYFCHGYAGDARTQAAALLQPPPRDFTRAPALDGAAIAAALRTGRPGTAMASFAGLLSEAEITAVAVFVEQTFVRRQTPNTRYHTAANGWPDHAQRYGDAFEFVRGNLALDTPANVLSAAQQRGQWLFRTACMSCHDAAESSAATLQWSARAMSYPRPGILAGGVLAPSPAADAAAAQAASAVGPVDALSSASVYARHDRPPSLRGLNAQQRRGARLYQANCAFCHAADGSGANWIGRFMQPPARDLRRLDAAAHARLAQTLRDGLPGASMPAWGGVWSQAQIEAVAAYVRRVFVPAPTSR